MAPMFAFPPAVIVTWLVQETGIAAGVAAIVLTAARELCTAHGGYRLKRLSHCLEIPIIALVTVFAVVLVVKIIEVSY